MHHFLLGLTACRCKLFFREIFSLYSAWWVLFKGLGPQDRSPDILDVAPRFVSHWWGEPVVQFTACVEKHSHHRKLSPTVAYWVCAYANNQPLGMGTFFSNIWESRALPKFAGIKNSCFLSEEEAEKAHDMAEKAVRCVFEENHLILMGRKTWKFQFVFSTFLKGSFFLVCEYPKKIGRIHIRCFGVFGDEKKIYIYICIDRYHIYIYLHIHINQHRLRYI